jgi:hypothetical protein
LADLGFKYDATFGYPDMAGFRNGVCHPFKPYDILAKNEINILEIPLVIMDGTLFKVPFDDAWDIIKQLVDVTAEYKGVIAILWHTSTFDETYYGAWKKLYEKILKLLLQKNAWMTMVRKYMSTGRKTSSFEVRFLEANEYADWNLMVDQSKRGAPFYKTSWLDSFDGYDFKIIACIQNGRIVVECRCRIQKDTV